MPFARGYRSKALLLTALAALNLLACAGAVDARSERLRARAVVESSSVSALSREQAQRLRAGQLVTVPMVHEIGERRYTGGASHLVVHASAQQLFDALSRPEVIERVLPRTKRASLLGQGEGWRRIELEQGNRWVAATYTVNLRQQPVDQSGAYRVVFALDRERPHDVDDLWGSFALTPIDEQRCVVSVMAFVDLGDSLAVLFEGRIQELILSTPWHVQRYLDRRASQSAQLQPADAR